MRRLLLCIVFLSTIFMGCETSSQFILTGQKHPSLSKSTEIKLIFIDDGDKYEEIGIVEVKGTSLIDRVDVAVQIARKYGGDVLMLLTAYRDEEKMSKFKREVEQIKKKQEMKGRKFEKMGISQFFLVLKAKKEKEISKEISKEDKDKDMGLTVRSENPQKDSKIKDDTESLDDDYEKIPRATYRLLIENSRFVRGQHFRGTLFPIDLYHRVPKSFKYKTGRDKNVLIVSTRTRKYRMYLIVPGKMTRRIAHLIKQKKKLDVVYLPVGVYKSGYNKYPVLEFIKEIKE